MNYLAHLFLSGKNEDLLIGNFIADSIKNKEVVSYSKMIQEGIFLHRKIDSFTDNHPMVRQGTRRLRPHHRKYSPVVLDVLYDFILIKNWDKYSLQPLSDFTDWIYAILQKRMPILPLQLQKRLPMMIEHNWLEAYGTPEGLQYTFQRMDQRTKFPSNFVLAVEDLQADYSLFETEFNVFFPDVIHLVNTVLEEQK